MRKLMAAAAIASMLVLTAPISASASYWRHSGHCVLTDDGMVFFRGFVSTFDGYTGSIQWVYRMRELGTATGWTRLHTGFRKTEILGPGYDWSARFKSFPMPTAGFAYQLTAKLTSHTWPLTGFNDNKSNPYCRIHEA